MAKQQKRKQTRPSWFQKQFEKNGPDFLMRLQPKEIQREAFNIVRDITRANITQRDIKYLFTLNILSNVKIAVYDRYIETFTYHSSMSFVLQSPNGMQILKSSYGVDDSVFQRHYNTNNDLLTAYVGILNALDAMIAAVQTGYASNEQKEIYFNQVYSSVQYQLSRFKFII